MELAEWRARFSASVSTVDAIPTLERTRVDRAETKVAGRLAGLYEQRELRDDWLASHPEAALRLAGLDREVESLGVVMGGPTAGHELQRGLTRAQPGLREAPVVERSLDLGIGL